MSLYDPELSDSGDKTPKTPNFSLSKLTNISFNLESPSEGRFQSQLENEGIPFSLHSPGVDDDKDDLTNSPSFLFSAFSSVRNSTKPPPIENSLFHEPHSLSGEEESGDKLQDDNIRSPEPVSQLPFSLKTPKSSASSNAYTPAPVTQMHLTPQSPEESPFSLFSEKKKVVDHKKRSVAEIIKDNNKSIQNRSIFIEKKDDKSIQKDNGSKKNEENTSQKPQKSQDNRKNDKEIQQISQKNQIKDSKVDSSVNQTSKPSTNPTSKLPSTNPTTTKKSQDEKPPEIPSKKDMEKSKKGNSTNTNELEKTNESKEEKPKSRKIPQLFTDDKSFHIEKVPTKQNKAKDNKTDKPPQKVVSETPQKTVKKSEKNLQTPQKPDKKSTIDDKTKKPEVPNLKQTESKKNNMADSLPRKTEPKTPLKASKKAITDKNNTPPKGKPIVIPDDTPREPKKKRELYHSPDDDNPKPGLLKKKKTEEIKSNSKAGEKSPKVEDCQQSDDIFDFDSFYEIDEPLTTNSHDSENTKSTTKLVPNKPEENKSKLDDKEKSKSSNRTNNSAQVNSENSTSKKLNDKENEEKPKSDTKISKQSTVSEEKNAKKFVAKEKNSSKNDKENEEKSKSVTTSKQNKNSEEEKLPPNSSKLDKEKKDSRKILNENPKSNNAEVPKNEKKKNSQSNLTTEKTQTSQKSQPKEKNTAQNIPKNDKIQEPIKNTSQSESKKPRQSSFIDSKSKPPPKSAPKKKRKKEEVSSDSWIEESSSSSDSSSDSPPKKPPNRQISNKKRKWESLAATRSRRVLKNFRKYSSSSMETSESEDSLDLENSDPNIIKDSPEKPKKIKKPPKPKPEVIIRLLDWNFNNNVVKDDLIENYSGPIETPESQPLNEIFKGMSFIVTGLNNPGTPSKKVAGAIILFDEINKAIVKMGGILVKDNNIVKKSQKLKKGQEKPINSKPSCVIIAPCAYRTFKYLLGLGARVPCLHYLWVALCFKHETYLDPKDFLLPAGINLENKIIKLTPDIITNFPPAISELTFYDTMEHEQMRIEIVGTHQFKEQWSHLLREAGAKIVKRLFSLQDSRIDFILSDSQPTEMILGKARAFGLPLCTIEWLIQSLIAQKAQDMFAHVEYTIPF